VEKEDNVFPMIPAGAGMKDMILGPPEGPSQARARTSTGRVAGPAKPGPAGKERKA
jgi:hypothetical protein